MKSILVHLICTTLVLGVVLSCSKSSSPTEKTLYTCGMHPQIVQDKPGNCPICGMKLQPVRKNTAAAPPATGSETKLVSTDAKLASADTKPVSTDAKAAAATGGRKIKYYKSTMMLGEISQTPRKDSMGMDMVPVYEDEAAESSTISIDPVTVQNMGIRTGIVTKGPLVRTVRTVGVIDYNETALTDVTTKFRGWIEKLDVDSTGKQVRKGEPLFDIYSPELYSAQNEYVIALTQGRGELKASARQKLKLFDITDDQIAELEKTRQPRRTLRVDAPRDGIVVEKMAVQGQMVEAGMKLYRLADLSIVWVQSQVYEQDLPFVSVGQEAQVSLSYLPDRKFSGRVTYIYPTVDEKTRTGRVRMEFHNPGYFLKPGMFVTVELRAELTADALLVPDSAILRSGEERTVFVALEGGKFEPRTVAIGPRNENNMYQVLSGLKEGERVVTSGQFMLDSESQLREAIQKMLEPTAAAASSPAREQAQHVSASSSPLPEHVQHGSEPQPTAQEHAQHASASSSSPSRSPAETTQASDEYVCPTEYACPMPEHMNIKYNHPGKCPICGMTLIPASAQKPGMRTSSLSASPTPHQYQPQ